MRARPWIAALVATGFLVIVPAALADGPPASPGAVVGGRGIRPNAGALRFVALPDLQTTLVEAIHVHGGAVAGFRSVRGRLGVPLVTLNGDVGGVSPNGHFLVLADADIHPGRRSESDFVVLRTSHLRVVERVALPGEFAFDALSPVGDRMYLIEHTSDGDLSRYRVRVYDLLAHRLLPDVIADRTAWETDMRGYPYARATGPGGRWVYTLYGGVPHVAFVHALDTVRGVDVCLDLPRQSRGAVATARMRLRLHGRRLRVVDEQDRDVATFRVPPRGGDGRRRQGSGSVSAGVAAASGLAAFVGAVAAFRRRRR